MARARYFIVADAQISAMHPSRQPRCQRKAQQRWRTTRAARAQMLARERVRKKVRQKRDAKKCDAVRAARYVHDPQRVNASVV